MQIITIDAKLKIRVTHPTKLTEQEAGDIVLKVEQCLNRGEILYLDDGSEVGLRVHCNGFST